MKSKANGMSSPRTSPLIASRRKHKRLRPKLNVTAAGGCCFQHPPFRDTSPSALRVFTHGHFENIALIATVPNRCLHLIQWFPGVQQLNEYKRDSLILSKSMEEGRATPAPPPPSIPFWDNSSISLALAATMPYSSLCQWNNTASVAMGRAQQQLRAYADIAACEADASVFLHSNDASFFFKFQNRDGAREWTGTGASLCRLMFWRRQRYKNSRETQTQRRRAPPLERQGGFAMGRFSQITRPDCWQLRSLRIRKEALKAIRLTSFHRRLMGALIPSHRSLYIAASSLAVNTAPPETKTLSRRESINIETRPRHLRFETKTVYSKEKSQ